jgi:hypothetical protein
MLLVLTEERAMTGSKIAARNRQIKAVLERAFGRGKVTVRGERGTAYGYVRVRIDHTPLDWDSAGRLKGQCKALLRAAGVDLGLAYTDDTCQETTDQCRIEFNRCRYQDTIEMGGKKCWGKPYGSEKWEPIAPATVGAES